jgi:succinyl-diaminopimelate desuccinylase
VPKRDVKRNMVEKLDEREAELVELCSRLVQIPSQTPPSDTREIAQVVADMLKQVDGAEVTFLVKEEPVVNVVARIKGKNPGKRLVFNGHLDTFPLSDIASWTVDPFGGLVKDGRVYGLGVSDMKAGVVSMMFAFSMLAECRDEWSGEVVLTLVGDEERGGMLGTQYILNEVPDTVGDVVINGDTGSPMVLRFGEKGYYRFELNAEGVAGHSAHVHKGINAIERLIKGMTQIKAELEKLPVNASEKVTKAIIDAGDVSEQFSGKGETEVLQSITVSYGVIEGGVLVNLIPAKASAKVDVRLPVGVTLAQVDQKIQEIVASTEGLSYHVFDSCEATWSDVEHEVFQRMVANGLEVMGENPVVTIRVGGSDARFYRDKGVPTVNCGLTPYHMGAPDEYIEVSELVNVAKIHALTAFDILTD